MKQKAGTAQGRAVPVLSYPFCFGITATQWKKTERSAVMPPSAIEDRKKLPSQEPDEGSSVRY
jgi:hypothetical protein